jgi:voltage-gated potassium channel
LKENFFRIEKCKKKSTNLKIITSFADRVVLPYEIGGYRITQALLRPIVVDFIDEVFSRSDLGLGIEEVKIVEESKLVGKSIAESEIRNDFNTIIVGIYRDSGKLIYNPRSDTMIEKEDILIVIGEIKKLDKLQEKANEK